MANNIHGNQNEIIFVEELNEKLYKNLNQNLQTFIYSLDSSVTSNTKIEAQHRGGESIKDNVKIMINGNTYKINVVSGKNNSVHQEDVKDFINDLSIPQNIADSFRRFIWGDGTLDGTGTIMQRLGYWAIKKQDPSDINVIQNYLNDPTNKRKLLVRFLQTGRNTSSVDYIYYRTPKKNTWKPIANIINFHNTQLKIKKPSIGNLTLQAWKRSLNGQCDGDRGQIQLKWNIHRDIEKIF